MHNLFISHSWNHGVQYDKLISLLDSYPYFAYKNYSVPKNDPIHNAANDRELEEAIRSQMKYASCVLILAGVYATYSKWINIEIRLAKELKKKIIAVAPFGAEHTSLTVRNAADEIVRWNSQSIVSAIRD